MYKNEEEAVNQDSENVVLRAFEVLRSWKVATIQLKEKTDETQYSLWISETLKLSAEVKLKDEAEINIGGMIILCTRGFKYIAELLNENSNMLLGFSTDSTNSLGSISEDGTDSALYRMAEEYEVKVVQLEKVGLLNFANMVRQISANFILGLMEINGDKEKESYSSMEKVCYSLIESAASRHRRVVSDAGLEFKVLGSSRQY